MKEITFSDEQNDIFDYAEKGILNMCVQAVAGAGKTTTLVECVNRVGDDKKIMLLAHNRSAKDTLKERLGERDNVHIYTIHGLAWRMFVEHFDFEPEIDVDKYRNYINQNLDIIATEAYKIMSKTQRTVFKFNVFDLVDKARYNLKQSEKEIRKLATKKYGMPLVADECHVVANILKWGYENTRIVDYQDLLWFPSEFGYFTKKYTADVIMLDEAQDASLAQQDVISRCFMRQTRFFYVGDPDQSINNWCGADTEAFEHLKDEDTFRRASKEFPLTTNYRCGTNIIEYAKRYTNSNIHAREGAQDGVVRHDAYLNEIEDGDMVLCRNISPLMEVYRRGVSLGKRMYFRGEQLGKILISDVDSAFGDTIPEIITSMKRRLIATWDRITMDEGLDPKETMLNPRVTSILDTIKTMENLPSTVETRHDLEKFIQDVFTEEGREGIQLSTIHRAKGLEANNVFIVCPSLVPSPLARLPWQLEEERHLQYVMCTRPKDSLNFVSEKDVRPHKAFSESNSLHKELMSIKSEIETEDNKTLLV